MGSHQSFLAPCHVCGQEKARCEMESLPCEHLWCKECFDRQIAAKSAGETTFLPLCCDQCPACFEWFRVSDMQVLPCNHLWCGNCLTDNVIANIADESTFPPRCCSEKGIPSTTIEKHLRRNKKQAILQKYKEKRYEYSQRNRVYCHHIHCKAFIPPRCIHNNDAICSKCHHHTCAKCRAKWHWGPCAVDAAFDDLAHVNKWKPCPGCKNLTERREGCAQMKCACGAVFCYRCGEFSSHCRCVDSRFANA